MQELVRTINDQLKSADANLIEKHPITIATYFHQEFLNKIHPFSDGNGRIARMFLNLILLKNGYSPIFIKEVDRKEYLNCFELTDDDMHPMLDFMADRSIESLEEKFAFMRSQK